jgi:hypothetical protein
MLVGITIRAALSERRGQRPSAAPRHWTRFLTTKRPKRRPEALERVHSDSDGRSLADVGRMTGRELSGLWPY